MRFTFALSALLFLVGVTVNAPRAHANEFSLGVSGLYGETILGLPATGENSVFRDFGYGVEGRLALPMGRSGSSIDLFGRFESQTQKNISDASQELSLIGGTAGADINLAFLFAGAQVHSGRITVRGNDANGNPSSVDIYYSPIGVRTGITIKSGKFQMRAGVVYNLSQNSEVSGMTGTFQPVRKWNGFLQLSIPLASAGN